ncbi:28S ribosomal protein S9, mitochondrial isoform X1 [Python bivittatus]|uniref:Small ribosomal subunit protein uS9m n=2 Tax=Python bivittatus TaxID=176946 RepID=A0A9F3QTI5_PYTBI|nr:28S ribosomal protein S9, mitochondrial isoform X1 [Python bivittatus]XP_015744385.1 28S ribosomal protein S9, mitochondrial isoform X1 [Python bivittatus]
MATAAVGRVLAGGRSWSTAARTGKQLMGSKMVRLICVTTSASQKKSNVPSGPEQYTESFIKKQIEEFNIGKRHLANMMGEDPESFTQEDIDKAIAYLFPSGLFEKKARPFMKHPDEVFPKESVAQWDEDGRPFNFLFYTGKQSYYSLMHEIYSKLLHIQNYQDQLCAQGLFSENKAPMNLIGSRWLIKEELEEMLVEKLSDQDYSQCIRLLERLVTLPYCDIEEDYLLKFRRQLTIQSKKQTFEPLKYDERGVAFSTAEGNRKSAKATATVYGNGSGKFTINGDDYLLYFPVLQDREQLMFPFQFLDQLEKYDVICSVSGGGRSGQAGAVRLAVARALCSFISEDEVEFMRQAGLLTLDPRVRERKKPGQEGARRKFTWKKR